MTYNDYFTSSVDMCVTVCHVFPITNTENITCRIGFWFEENHINHWYLCNDFTVCIFKEHFMN